MLFAFLSGFFNYVFILLLLITVHELGHLLIASLLNYKIDKIIIYPFGGITKYNEPLNTSMKKEFYVLLGGPIVQELFFILILVLYNNNLITNINYDIFVEMHETLLLFNILPIIPLDGSKLLNLGLELIFSYKSSNIILIIVSYVSIFILVLFEKRLIIIFLSILLIKNIIIEIKNHDFMFNKFILERYLFKFSFKKGNNINNIKKIKRERKHFINKNGKLYEEEEYLKKHFEI